MLTNYLQTRVLLTLLQKSQLYRKTYRFDNKKFHIMGIFPLIKLKKRGNHSPYKT